MSVNKEVTDQMLDQVETYFIMSKFSSEEKFVVEAERVFSSLRGCQSVSLGVDMRYDKSNSPPVLDSMKVRWRISPAGGHRLWSSSEVEIILGVVASHKTPNVKETQLCIEPHGFLQLSAGGWELMSKHNIVSCVDFVGYYLSRDSTWLRQLIHVQKLKGGRSITPEGALGICELLKVSRCFCCWSIVEDIL